jgi:hypothetical protein
VLASAKPLSELRRRFPQESSRIDAAVVNSGRPEAKLVSLSMVSRRAVWTVLLDGETAAVVGYLPLDSF